MSQVGDTLKMIAWRMTDNKVCRTRNSRLFDWHCWTMCIWCGFGVVEDFLFFLPRPCSQCHTKWKNKKALSPPEFVWVKWTGQLTYLIDAQIKYIACDCIRMCVCVFMCEICITFLEYRLEKRIWPMTKSCEESQQKSM